MIKSKKQMFLVIIIFTLVMMLGTISYAFFNYTRTGSENTVRVGRLSFATNQTRTINLTDTFPIDSSSIETDTDNVGEVLITISGDTDYVNGIEYLVSTEDVHIYTSEGKIVPVSLDVTVNGLGTESSTYFTSRNSKDTTIYKKLGGNAVVGEQQILVGYIKPNATSGTAEGVNGSISIKAYFDNDKIAITDTIDESESWVDGRTYITSSEWNSLSTNGATFKIRVEANTGIWVAEPFYDVMQRNSVMDNINSTYVSANTGIDFSQISSNTNGKGIYTKSGTENDAYPIMYYRGDVNDNNVLFGGFCWKAVITTETGGIKLIYNGVPVNNQCGEDRTLVKNQIITFDVGDYALETRDFGDDYEYNSATESFVLTGNVVQTTLASENINSLIGKYICNPFQFDRSGRCGNLLKIHSYNSSNNEISFTQVTRDSSIMLDDDDPYKDNVHFNSQASALSFASVGYMYGVEYTMQNGLPNELKFNQVYTGSSFTYENGVYKLVDPVLSASPDSLITHHYTCGLTDPNGTCVTLMYYRNLFTSGGVKFFNYINLTDGKDVNDVLEEAFTNTNDSLAKIMIDTWYENNMTNYTNKLEDTVYCNDRSIGYLGGFDPNGGSLTKDEFEMRFSKFIRRGNTPSVTCSNKRDSFTVSSERGNGKLDYPVAMLTSDELDLAGAIYHYDNPNPDMYLDDGNGFWTMTPTRFQTLSYVERLYAGGNTGGTRVDHEAYMSGFRPVISLKEGTGMISGNGTSANPYVVK